MLSMKMAHCRTAVDQEIERDKALEERLGCWKGGYLVGMIPRAHARP